MDAVYARACETAGPAIYARGLRTDSTDSIAYARRVSAFFSRIVQAFVLLAALTWIVLPVAVFASPRTTYVEGDACPCCDGPATVGPIMACPGCQAAIPTDDGLPVRHWALSTAWIRPLSAAFSGINPAPAEPPPR